MARIALINLRMALFVASLGIVAACLQGSDTPSGLVAFKDLAIPAEGWEQEVAPGFPWNELIVSWNAQLPAGAKLIVKAALPNSEVWYTMGIWSDDKATRQSVPDQKTDQAKVDTDTLIAAAPQGNLKIRLEAQGGEVKADLLTLAFANRQASAKDQAINREAWGKTLEPPKRAQMSYPNGEVICSATATSMLLGYWATQLNQPIVDRDVPLVCEGVFDPKWPGTGNWPFNTAFAGEIPGMQAYVARLWSIPQLEAWIAKGIPVACSVSYDLLKGKGAKGKNDGHLVVLVGFTPEGDPIFNDPGRNVVRMTYKRPDFDSAWASSGRTCYLVYPKFYGAPDNKDKCWLD